MSPLWGGGGILSTTASVAVPPPAAANGLNTVAWSWAPDPSLADIDTAHQSTTRPPSLNWNWTSKDPFGHPYDNPLGLSYDGAKQALVIGSSASNASANGLSMFWQGTSSGQGRLLDMTKPFFIDVLFSFDQSLAPGGGGFTPCPAISLYTFFNDYIPGDEFTEKDIAEFQKAGAGAVGYYQNTFESNVSGGNYNSTNGLLDNTSYGSPTFTASVFNHIGCLYLPTTYNGGTGIWRPYFNIGMVTANLGGTATLSWTLTGPAQPGSVGPAGAFSYPQTTSQKGAIIINAGVQELATGGGPGWPCYIKAVNIYGFDTSVLVTIP